MNGQEKRRTVIKGRATMRIMACAMAFVLTLTSVDLTAVMAADADLLVVDDTGISDIIDTQPEGLESSDAPVSQPEEAGGSGDDLITADEEPLTKDTAAPEDADISAEPTVSDNTAAVTADKMAFNESITIDGILITVTADEGVFPEDAILSVNRILDEKELLKLQAAVDEAAADDIVSESDPDGTGELPEQICEETPVEDEKPLSGYEAEDTSEPSDEEDAESTEETEPASAVRDDMYAFDITILDKDGNKIQPDTQKGEVKVAFSNPDADSFSDDEYEIYHIDEEKEEATKLDTNVETVNTGDEKEEMITASTDSFSPFILLGSSGTITLHTGLGFIQDTANWQEVSAKTDSADPSYKFESTGSVSSLPTPSCDEATLSFVGWYDNKACSGSKITSPVAGRHYYALWNRTKSTATGTYMTYEYKNSGSTGAINSFGILSSTNNGRTSTSQIKTTYANGGYRTYYKLNNSNATGSGTGLQVVTSGDPFKQVSGDLYVAISASLEDKFVRYNYFIWNKGDAEVTNFNIGIAADVQIGSNDYAPLTIYPRTNTTDPFADKYVVMSDGTNEFRLYYGGPTVQDAQTLWTGRYSSHTSNVFTNLQKDQTGIDSTLTVSWKNISIPAGETVCKSVLLGAGQAGKVVLRKRIMIDKNGDGNIGSNEIEYVTEGQTIPAPDAPDIPGHVFVEWNTRPDGGGTSYQPGDALPTDEDITLHPIMYQILNTADVTLKLDGALWPGRRVQLYQGSALKYTLEDLGGTYTNTTVINGTYDVYVDGSNTGKSLTFAATTDSERQAVTVEFNKVTAKMKLNDEFTEGIGTVTLRQEGITKYTMFWNNAESAFIQYIQIENLDNNAFYDIFLNGENTGEKFSDDDFYKEFSFYMIDIGITDDTPWTDAAVALRAADGTIAHVPAYNSSLTRGNTTHYTRLLAESDTEYDIYINNRDMHTKVSAVAGKHTAGFTFYKATVKLDGVQPTDKISMSNGVEYYEFTGPVGSSPAVYTVNHAFLNDFDDEGEAGGDEKVYNITIPGITVTESLTIDSAHKVLERGYQKVTFYNYVKESGSSTYSWKPIRELTVKYTETVPQYRGNVLYPGMTFAWWSTESKTPGTGAGAEYDFNTPVIANVDLYAQYMSPTVEIKDVVRTDSNGTPNGTGAYYKMSNLTIYGFDPGEESVQALYLRGEKIEDISIISGSTLNYTVTNGALSKSIKFNPAVSMEKAQAFLRNNILVKPETNVEHRLMVRVLDKGGTYVEATNAATTLSAGASPLTSSSLTTGKYVVTENKTFTGSAGNNGMSISGTVVIYIPAGKTLTATGGAASETTGGGAGIYVPSGSTLIILGEGKVVATGGNAAPGSAGSQGDGSYYSSSNDHMYQGKGGNGGSGGGGAGAGIGTKGGTGGSGGSGGAAWDIDKDDGGKTGQNGRDGSNGSAGSEASAAGTIYIASSINIDSCRGGYASSSGGSGGAHGSNRGTCAEGESKIDGDTRLSAGGAGGGGGGSGYAGSAFGGGGTGGSGGGGGASAGYVWGNARVGGGGGGGGLGYANGSAGANGTTEAISNKNSGIDRYPSGGGAPNGATGGKGHVDGDKYSEGGDGGDGASNSYQRGSVTVNTPTAALASNNYTYSIRFVNKAGTVLSSDTYIFGTSKNITMPAYTGTSKENFHGWQVSAYGVSNGCNNAANQDLTRSNTNRYAAGHSFTIIPGVSGNITFTAITESMDGIMDDDTVAMTIKEPMAYDTYTVTVKVDGIATNVGNIKIGDQVVSTDPDKTYTLTKVRKQSAASYGAQTVTVNGQVIPGVTVAANGSATVNYETMRVRVRGKHPSSVTLVGDGAPALMEEGVVRANSVDWYVYSAQRLTNADNPEYPILVDGKPANESVAYGETQDITYGTITVKVNPVGLDADELETVELRSTDGQDTIFLTRKPGSGTPVVFDVNLLPTGKTYNVYINGERTADSIVFGTTENSTEITKTISFTRYTTTVRTKLNGELTDLGDLYFGSIRMNRQDTGVYSVVTYSSSSAALKLDGNTLESSVSAGTDKTYDYYKLTYVYSNGTTTPSSPEEGLLPVDTTIYKSGNEVTLKSGVNLSNRGKTFAGWIVGTGDAKAEGSIFTINSVDQTAIKAAWAATPFDTTNFNVELSQADFTYNSQEQTPTVRVLRGTTELIEGRDYSLSYSNDLGDNDSSNDSDSTRNAGNIKITVTGMGDYSGTLTQMTVEDYPEDESQSTTGTKLVDIKYTIHRKNITVNGLRARDREYNGTTTVELIRDDVVLEGLVPGDAVSLTSSNTAEMYSPTARARKAVNMHTIALVGEDAPNYILDELEPIYVNIGRKALTADMFSLTPSVVYNGTYQEPEITAEDNASVGSSTVSIIGNGDFTVSYSDNKNVGTATVTITAEIPETELDADGNEVEVKDESGNTVYRDDVNYSGTISKTFEITKAPVTLKANDASSAYGADVAALSYSVASGTIYGEDDLTSLNIHVSTEVQKGYPADTYTDKITVSYTPNDNYEITTRTGTYTVTRAAVGNDMLWATAKGYSGIFDGAEHGITVNPGSVLPDDSIKVTYSTTENGTYSETKPTYSDAGTYTTYYRVSSDNVDGFVTGSASVSISKKPVTLSANNNTITYGEAPAHASDGYSASGFVEEHADSPEVTYTYTYTQYRNAGTYSIIPAAEDTTNYTYTCLPGTLTVSPKPVTLTWSADAVTIKPGETAGVTAVVEGTVNGDLVSVGSYSGNTATEAGEHNAVAAGLAGTNAGNYVLSEDETTRTHTYTVTVEGEAVEYKTDLYVQWSYTDTLNYTGSLQSVTASFYKLGAGDAHEAVTGLVPVYEGSNTGTDVGNYMAAVTGFFGTDSDQYKLASENAGAVLNWKIVKASNSVSTPALTSSTWYYGDAAPAPVSSADFGAVYYEYAPVNNWIQGFIKRWSTEVPSQAGTYKVRACVDETANYDGAESEMVEFTISPAVVEVAAVDKSSVYGASLEQLTYTYMVAHGVVTEDEKTNLGVTATTEATSSSNVGDYPITPSVTNVNSNITVNCTKGVYSITRSNGMSVAVDALGSTYVYDGNPHGLGEVTVTGINDQSAGTISGLRIYYGTRALDQSDYGTGTDESPTFIDVGTHTVYYYIIADNYSPVSGSANVTITKATREVQLEDKHVTFGSSDWKEYTFVDGGSVTRYYAVGGPYHDVVTRATETGANEDVTYLPSDLYVDACDLTGNTVFNSIFTLSQSSYVYDGTAKTPSVTAVWKPFGEANSIITEADYEVAYAKNIEKGTATVTITGKGNLTGTFVMTFTIGQKSVTLTANTASSVYGNAIADLTYTSNVVLTEADINAIKPKAVTTAKKGYNVGIYPITVDYKADENYAVTVVNADYTISAADLTMVTEDYEGIYDGDFHDASVRAKTVRLLDSATIYYSITQLTGNNYLSAGSTSFPEIKNAGTHTVYYYAVCDNYNPASGSVKVKINKKAATVQVPDAAMIYGEDPAAVMSALAASDPASGLTVSGLVSGDTASAVFAGSTISYSTDYVQYGDVSSTDNTYYITGQGLTATNYDVEYTPGTLTVDPKEIASVTWPDETDMIYDGREHTINAVPDDICTPDQGHVALTYGEAVVSGRTFTNRATDVGSYYVGINGIEGAKAYNYTLNITDDSNKVFNWSIVKPDGISDGQRNEWTVTPQLLSVTVNEDQINYEYIAQSKYGTPEVKGSIEKVDDSHYRLTVYVPGTDNYPGIGDTAAEYEIPIGNVCDTDLAGLNPVIYGQSLNGDFGDPEKYVTNYTQGDPVGTYTIMKKPVVEEGVKTNYTPATFEVFPLPVSLAWGITEFTYDGTSKVVTATISNRIGSDDVMVSTYENNVKTQAGTYTAAATALSGADSSNYTLESGTNITKEWSITAADNNSFTRPVALTGWTYGDTPNIPVSEAAFGTGDITYTYYLDDGNGNITATKTTGANSGASSEGGAPVKAGTYWIVATIPATSDYNAVTSLVQFTIDKRPIVLTVSDRTKDYGAEIADLNTPDSYVMSGSLVEGDNLGINVTTTAVATSPAGVYPITITTGGTGAVGADNYEVTKYNGIYTIHNTGDTLPYSAADYNGIYDGLPHGITVTPEQGAVNAEVYYSNSPLSATDYGSGYSVSPVLTNVGTATVYYFITADNYPSVAGSRTITITRKEVTVTAQPKTITYGQAPNAGTDSVSYSGFEGNDTAAALSLTPTYTYSYNQYDPATDADHNYTITPSVAATTNYTFTPVSGVLTVVPKEVTLKWNKDSFTYDSTDKSVTAKVTNLESTDSVVVATYADNTKTDAGSYTARALTLGGDKAGSYFINTNAATTTHNWVINTGINSFKKEPEVTSWSYGDEPSTPTSQPDFGTPKYYYSEKANGPYTLTPPKNAGKYYIKAVIDATDNYPELTSKPVAFTIYPMEVTVTADDQFSTQGTSLNRLTYSLSKQPAAGDKFNVSINAKNGENALNSSDPVGSYPINVSVDTTANYKPVIKNGTYHLLTSGLGFKVKVEGGGAREYDGKFHGIEVQISDKEEGVDPVVYYTTRQLTDEQQVDIANCALPESPGRRDCGSTTIYYYIVNNGSVVAAGSSTVTINKKALTVKANDADIYVGQDPANKGVTYVGFENGETAANLGGTLTYTYTYSKGDPAGDYLITPKGFSSTNYSIRYESGTLKVWPVYAEVTTIQPGTLSTNKVTLNGLAEPAGKFSITGFSYKVRGSADNYTKAETVPTNGQFSKEITGLNPGTDYVYYAYGIRKDGVEPAEVKGDIITFRTVNEETPVQTGEITVSVVNKSITKQVSVVVTVEQGNVVLATKKADNIAANSSVDVPSFTGLAEGHYNVVVRTLDGTFVETGMIDVESGETQTTSFDIPDLEGTLSSVVEIKTPDTPAVAVDGLADIVTTQEKEEIQAGTKDVEVKLEVQKVENTDNTNNSGIMGIINSAKADNSKLNMDTFLDLSLIKVTTEKDYHGNPKAGGTKEEDIGSQNNKILEIAIPYETEGKDGIVVYKYHDGVPSALIKIETRPTAYAQMVEGTYFIGDGYIFVYTSEFSIYAIGYEDPSAGTGGGGGAGGGGGTTPGETPDFTLDDNSEVEPGTVIASFDPENAGKEIEAGYVTEDGQWHPIEGTLTIGADGKVKIEGLPSGELEIKIRIAATDAQGEGEWKSVKVTVSKQGSTEEIKEQSYVIHYILEYNGKQVTKSTEPVKNTEIISRTVNGSRYYGISADKAFFDSAAARVLKGSDNPAEKIASYTIVGKAVYTDGSPLLKTGTTDALDDIRITVAAADFVDDAQGLAYKDLPVSHNDIYVYGNVGAYATDKNNNGVVITAPSGVRYSGLPHRVSSDPAGKKTGAGKRAAYDLDITVTDTKLRQGGSSYELVYGKDYTVSYKNNVNASVVVSAASGNTYYKQIYDETKSSSKWPQITINGKGNYSGMKTVVYFDILPLSVTETRMAAGNYADCVGDYYTLNKNGGINLNLKPVRYTRTFDKELDRFVTNRERTSGYAMGRDVSVELQKLDVTENSWKRLGDITDGRGRRQVLKNVKTPGSYRVRISGMGNYCGSVYDNFMVYPHKSVMFSSLKLKTAKADYAEAGVNAASLVTAINTKVSNAAGANVFIAASDYKVSLLPASDSARVSEDGTMALSAGKYRAYVSPVDEAAFALKYPGVIVNKSAVTTTEVRGRKLNKKMFAVNWNPKGEEANGHAKDIKIRLDTITAEDVTLGKRVMKNGRVSIVPLTEEELSKALAVGDDNSITVKGSYVLNDGRRVDNSAPGTYRIILYGKRGFADSTYYYTYKRVGAQFTAAKLNAEDAVYNISGATSSITVTMPDGVTRETVSGSGNDRFRISYKNNRKTGTATATVSVANDKTGYRKGSRAEVTFTISPKTVSRVYAYGEYSAELAGELFIKTAGPVKAGGRAPSYKLYQASSDGKKLNEIRGSYFSGTYTANTSYNNTYDLTLTGNSGEYDFLGGYTVDEAYCTYTNTAKKWPGNGEIRLSDQAYLIRDTGNGRMYTSEDMVEAGALTPVKDMGKGKYSVAYAGGCYVLPSIPSLTVDGHELKLAEGDYTISYNNNNRTGTGRMTVTLSPRAARMYDIGGSMNYSFAIVRQSGTGLIL